VGPDWMVGRSCLIPIPLTPRQPDVRGVGRLAAARPVACDHSGPVAMKVAANLVLAMPRTARKEINLTELPSQCTSFVVVQSRQPVPQACDLGSKPALVGQAFSLSRHEANSPAAMHDLN